MSELSITVCSFYITKRNAKKNKHIYYLNDSMKYTIDDSVYETNIQKYYRYSPIDLILLSEMRIRRKLFVANT